VIVAQLKISADWLADAYRQQEKIRVARKILTSIKVLCLVMMVALDALLVAKALYIPALVTVSLTLLLIFSRSFDRYVLARRRKSSPFWNKTVRVEMDDDGFRESSDLISSEVRWDAFTRCVALPDGFLLYHGPTIWRWLPFSAFVDNPSPELVREFLKSKVRKYERA
jgi:hypothetical protein